MHYIYQTSRGSVIETDQAEETQEETPEPSGTQDNVLPVLEPADKILMASSPDQNDMAKSDTPEPQRRNVLDKFTDRSKNIISKIYPPYEEERNEQKFDVTERKKAEKYAISTDQVLLTEVLGIKPANVNKIVSKPTPLAQVVEGRVLTDSTKDALEDMEGNSKLWIGKDYTNFIVKDFQNLDLPFIGEKFLFIF